MTYSIIGSGHVGTALARQFEHAGIAAGWANSRGPDTLVDRAAEIGHHVTAKALSDALQAEILILAVPFRAHVDIAHRRPDWSGHVIIDAMNAHGVTPEELGGRPSSELVASAFEGAQIVKTFNQLPAELLGSDPAQDGGRRVMFVSSDHEDAEARISQLVSDLGFAPIRLGKLAEGGALLRLRGPLVLQNLIKHD